jgi:hypothetical protein
MPNLGVDHPCDRFLQASSGYPWNLAAPRQHPRILNALSLKAGSLDQAKLLVSTAQQQNAAIGTDPPAIERGGDFLLADTWQIER